MMRPLSERWGVRLRVTALATLLVAFTLIIGGVAFGFFLRQSLLANLDSAQLGQAQTIARQFEAGLLKNPIATSPSQSSLVQVLDATGAVIASTADVDGEPPVLTAPPAAKKPLAETLTTSPLGEGGDYRIQAVPVQLSSGGGWVYVAGSLDQVDAAGSTLLIISFVAIPLGILIAALIMSRTVVLALKPVDRITRLAAAIDASGLHQRVPVPPTIDEIARLASTMNQMLTRLEDSAIQQRHFIGDASHELRSPLTALRLQIDIALAHPDPARSQQVLETVSGEVTRLIDLTEDLLYLARGTEGRPAAATRNVDLDDILRAEIHRWRTTNDLTVTVAALQPARVVGSQQDLARAIRNLIDNAGEHASSEIIVSLRNIAGTAVITITDDGPGIPPDQRDRIFLRFSQLDPARNRHAHTHFGLGLAIAQQIVDIHGGGLTVHDRDDQRPGASFSIRIPLTPTGAPLSASAPPITKSTRRRPVIRRPHSG